VSSLLHICIPVQNDLFVFMVFVSGLFLETSEPQLTDKQRQSALSRLGLQSSSARRAIKRGNEKELASAVATKLSNRSPRKVSVISSAVKPSISESADGM